MFEVLSAFVMKGSTRIFWGVTFHVAFKIDPRYEGTTTCLVYFSTQ